MPNALAPGPTFTIDYVARRVAIRLAHAEIDRIRYNHDWCPLRKTPSAWAGRSVEFEREEAAKALREAKALLIALGVKRKPRSQRKIRRDMIANRAVREFR